MRRILRKIAANEHAQLRDTLTLADPTAVDDLVENRMKRTRSGHDCRGRLPPPLRLSSADVNDQASPVPKGCSGAHFHQARRPGPKGRARRLDVVPRERPKFLVDKVLRDGVEGLDLGGSSAQSVILMLIVIALTVLQFRYVERRVQYQ